MTTNETKTLEVATELVRNDPGSNNKPGRAFRKRGIAITAILTTCAALAIVSGLHSRVKAETRLREHAQASAIPYVDVVSPKAIADGDEIALPGSTSAFNDTPIYARTSGYVKHWYVDIGARVKKGQLLATIETPELDQQLQQARADLDNAEANLQLAKITAARWQHLLETDSVSHQETDQAVSDLHSKQALVNSGKANVERLEQLQAFERVTAPFEGVVTGRNTDIGVLVQAGDNSGPKELFHMAAIQTLRVYVAVPEIYAAFVKNGERAKLTLDAFPGETLTGTIVRNADAIDATSRTLNVEVDVPNPTGRLLPGAYAFVHLRVPPHPGSVAIPSNALLFRAEGLRVGVVRNGHVELTPIAIGQDYGSTVEVISGLSARDTVIVNPSDSLANGAAVQLVANNSNGARQ
ncbi:MAG TPA: efflux RND transporter periplasmic adaptor subunit [Terriglobales bacterium]|nr:efflux RND transporter periplasmic adaptor subunit [Terriglobales bacterium]